MKPQKLHLITLLEPKGQYLRELQWWTKVKPVTLFYTVKTPYGREGGIKKYLLRLLVSNSGIEILSFFRFVKKFVKSLTNVMK